MKIDCKLRVERNVCASQQKKSRNSDAVLVLGKENGEVMLQCHTKQNKDGSKYKIKGNIVKVFNKFIHEGKFTVQLKEPGVNLIIDAKSSIQAKAFCQSLYLVHLGKFSGHLPLSNLKPMKAKEFSKEKPSLIIAKREDYPVTKAFSSDLQKLIASGLELNRIELRITRLKQLQQLDLSNNSIKVIPQEITNLTKLEVLNLSQNDISFVDISFFESNFMNSLRILKLSQNKLDRIPPEIGKLKMLENLSLDKNNLSILPESVCKISSLRELNVSENRLSFLPLTLVRMKLQHLDVSSNEFSLKSGMVTSSLNNKCLTLKETAAKACVRYRFVIKAGEIPATLSQYVSSHEWCYTCGRLMLQSYVRGCVRLNWRIVCLSASIYQNFSRFLPFVGKFCSLKCVNKSNSQFRAS